jgi:hypothetical protein
MRCLTLFALCIALLGCAFAPTSARAQEWTNEECRVSLWWPYSRDPGDCLTNGEKQAGLTGTFRDPDGALMRSNVAYAALRNLEGCDAISAPEPEIEHVSERVLLRGTTNQSLTITGSNFRCNTQAYFDAIPVPTNVLSATQIQITIPQELAERDGNFPIALRNRAPVVQRAGGPQGGPNDFAGSAPAPTEPGAAPQAPPISNARGCNTSITWPYFRRPGDCLTDAERARGMVGVYGNSRMAGEPAPNQPGPNEANGNIAPLPASTSSGGILGIFGSGAPNYGGGGLLDDNLLPPEQRDQ